MILCPSDTNYDSLHNTMRMLWEQHASWTRAVIISIAESLADEEQVTKRLLRNPTDIAAVFRPLYGNENAVRLDQLIKDHLVIAAQLVKAAKAGNQTAAADTEQKWYANADDIAVFLNTINPFWPREAMQKMWHDHLAMVKAQAVARLTKDYAADIIAYDEGEKLLLGMADDFTAGIAQQFPHCFGGL